MPRLATAEMADAYLSGVSVRGIAAAWMMKQSTVRARLRYAGVPMRGPGPTTTKALASMRAEMAAMRADAQKDAANAEGRGMESRQPKCDSAVSREAVQERRGPQNTRATHVQGGDSLGLPSTPLTFTAKEPTP